MYRTIMSFKKLSSFRELQNLFPIGGRWYGQVVRQLGFGGLAFRHGRFIPLRASHLVIKLPDRDITLAVRPVNPGLCVPTW